MEPQGLLGQLNQSMQQGVPAPGQISGTSPNFQPQLQPAPPSPMPDKSPASLIHRAAMRRGIDLSNHPQIQGQLPQPPQQGMTTLPIQDRNAQQPGIQVPKSEAELIVHALKDRLGLLGKHETAVRDAILPKKEEAHHAE